MLMLLSLGGILHEEEAAPLNAYLNYTQHGCRTWKAADFLAAAHVPCAFRQRQDIRDAGGAGYSPEQDEHGAETPG